ncbi:hypothetical protein AMATHDRAFT_63996 [Amanita thiersii Skay4041]|uniref:Beta-lactamase-related domain-containing protein n=1 Tax=Amanita thiersii Skay4041 TaxID=703135 RepID=A0A2A9NEL4_9AGAR|nr:hypothetical protein AMATHDRAFT_63996 [Amanita thiersii Skay4041]
MLSSWNSSGLAVVVVRRDNSVPGGWRREYASYGIAKDDGAPITPDTIFGIGSNSKLFVSFSVGLLVSNETLAKERGKALDWNTKAKDVLPGWGLMDETASKSASIQDMLTHRTGMPRHENSIAVKPGGKAEMIAMLRYLRPSAEFRQTFQYNNVMYESLAYLPTVLLNQSYESYVGQHIIKPLNMSSTMYSVKQAEASGNFADGYQWTMSDSARGIRGIRTATVPYFSRNGTENLWAGAGGVLSTARDMSIWVSMLLNNGRHPDTNETVIPEAAVDYAATGYTVFDRKASFPELSPKVYGCGQIMYSYRGHEVIEHGGTTVGFKSQITRFPNDNLAIVVLSNDIAANPIVESVKWRITDEIFGLSPIDWDGRYRQAYEASVKDLNTGISRPSDTKPPSAPFENMEKSYSHPTYGILRPCYANKGSNSSSPSSSGSYCSDVLSKPLTQTLLAASGSDAPSLIIPWSRVIATHLLLTHYTGNIFNASVIWTNRDVREAEGYGSTGDVVTGLDNRFVIEWVKPGQEGEGLAFKGGFWGSDGLDAQEPGGTGEESAEVWFKVDNNANN